MIGDTTHVRLTPNVKEVFFDVRQASAGGFVTNQVEAQLGIKVYEVEGVKIIGIGSTGPVPAGQLALQYVSPTTSTFGTKAVVFVTDGSNPNAAKNGLVVQNGIWTATGTATPPTAGYAVTYGRTGGTAANRGAHARCYVSTIANIWNNNSILETEFVTYALGVSETAGPSEWPFVYSSADLTGDGDTNDSLNPFDIAAPNAPPNNPEDGVVATLTETEMVNFNTLREVGHALGMSLSAPGYLGGSIPSRATRSCGRTWPAKTGTFSTDDIRELNLN